MKLFRNATYIGQMLEQQKKHSKRKPFAGQTGQHDIDPLEKFYDLETI